MNMRLSDRELVIHDKSALPLGPTGYLGRHVPFGKMRYASTYDDQIIPESEWKDYINHQIATKSRLSDMLVNAGWSVKNQRNTNYCWVFAAAAACEALIVRQQGKTLRLSPASVGSKITRFRNVGGWSTKAVEYIAEHGIVPSSLWPDTAISRSYDTTEAWKEAAKFQVIEWIDLEPRNREQLFSALLKGIPVAVGFNWWGHAVLALDVVFIDGKWGIRIANSWGNNWGHDGFGILLGNKALPDDAVAPRSLKPL